MLDDRVRTVLARLEQEDADERERGLPAAERSRQVARTTGQFLFALIGASATQRGPLWWAYQHRHHHLHSDEEDDRHSPRRHGFWWAHLGWWMRPGLNPHDGLVREHDHPVATAPVLTSSLTAMLFSS